MGISLDASLPGSGRATIPSQGPRRTTMERPYHERGGTGLSREAAAIWADVPPPREPVPSLPSGPYCRTCHYRDDAPGHTYLCGPPPPHP
jgi:hypothetical protein